MGIVFQTFGVELVQATKSQCGPFLGLSPFSPKNAFNADRNWAKSCIEFNRSMMEWLKTAKQIDAVILSSSLTLYVGADQHAILRQTAAGDETALRAEEWVIESLRESVQELRGLGKRVVLVAPPPTKDVDLSWCSDRMFSGRVSLGSGGYCSYPKTNYLARRIKVLQLLDTIQDAIDLPVIRLDEILCSDKQ